MRDFNECKAEVFRRSEEKIRIRKKRRTLALGLGIPLCLCAVITVTAVVSGPFDVAMDSANKAEIAPENEALMDMEIVADGAPEPARMYAVRDPEAAEAVQRLLDGMAEEPNAGKPPVFDQDGADLAYEYRITVYPAEGEAVRYLVTGLEVYCETTGQRRILSHWEAARLETLLIEEAAYE